MTEGLLHLAGLLFVQVKNYVKWFLKHKGVDQKDIGVITPYRRQARLIRDKLRHVVGHGNEVKIYFLIR
jgi:superfamily I DNA/RNA helicase